MNLGDYFDITNEEAANASYTTNGLLFSGRYRYVQVDSGATAANVKTGTVGYMRAGTYVASAITVNAGTALTNGSYQVAATVGSGGGAGAILGINVVGGVIVGNPTVVAQGFGFVSVPTFSLTALGGSGAVVAAQLNVSRECGDERGCCSQRQRIGSSRWSCSSGGVPEFHYPRQLWIHSGAWHRDGSGNGNRYSNSSQFAIVDSSSTRMVTCRLQQRH